MTALPRERLPDRRPSVTVGLSWAGHPFSVTVGFASDGRVLEVFASGARSGSDMQRLIDDACVVISLAMQHGACPGDLSRSLGSMPDPSAGMVEIPASVIGAIIGAVSLLEVTTP
jgi:hypothetical protein